jgi:hypothetical protein
MRHRILAPGAMVLLVACQATTPGSSTEEGGGGVGALPVARCADVPPISAPADRYRDEPVYVGNEQPTEEVRAWAVTQPGFQELWIDREHLGWITLAFSVDAEQRQSELEQLFPDVGVVTVQVDWTMEELTRLQERVGTELTPLFPVSSGIYTMQGVVGIGVGVLRADRVAAVAERFANEPICVEGIEVADAPAPGPQQLSGDGWRLIADQQGVGVSYRTGIATDDPSYVGLWRQVGLEGEPPPVDFETEVVIWFGAVYGSSCPNLRLDDVVVDQAGAIVHAVIVLADVPMACTADANPHAYLVALERARLPAGPFAIQLSADAPPGGVPEERTLVHVDLTPPGSVAGPDDIGFDPALLEPEPFVVEPGGFVETGFPFRYRLNVHCGVEWLGNLNGIEWRADVPDDAVDFLPDAWRPAVDGETETLTVEILLSEGPDPLLEATVKGDTVTYRPAQGPPPGCD